MNNEKSVLYWSTIKTVEINQKEKDYGTILCQSLLYKKSFPIAVWTDTAVRGNKYILNPS